MSIPINRNMGCTTYYCSCRACVVRNLLIIITGKGIDTIVATAIDALDFAACDCNIGISIYDAIFMLWFSIVWIPDCSTTTKYLVSSSPCHFYNSCAAGISIDASSIDSIGKNTMFCVGNKYWRPIAFHLCFLVKVISCTASCTHIFFLLSICRSRETCVATKFHMGVASKGLSRVAAGDEFVHTVQNSEVCICCKILVTSSINRHSLASIVTTTKSITQNERISIGIDSMGSNMNIFKCNRTRQI